MTVSLIHFLNICLIVTTAFPWSHSMLASNKNYQKKSFGMNFLSSFIFILIFFYFLYPDFYTSLMKRLYIKDFFFIFFSCTFSIYIENFIFKLKYKNYYIVKIPQNQFLLIFISIVIPIAEEILFRAALKYLFDLYNLHFIFYICISSVCFGLNHLIYSKVNVVTKSIWGLFFSISYYFTENILVTIISHIVINLIYVAIAFRKKNYV